MMNLIELQPGEGIYVGADGVHAWLDGREFHRPRRPHASVAG